MAANKFTKISVLEDLNGTDNISWRTSRLWRNSEFIIETWDPGESNNLTAVQLRNYQKHCYIPAS